jgi:hypothetical protein
LQRANELLATFDSIRHFYPEAKIINLENSKVNKQLAQQIQLKCDHLRNYSGDPLIIKSRSFNNKGIPWLIKILKFLHEEGSGISSLRVHLLCGRYLLNSNSLSQVNHVGACFRYYSCHDNVSTRYFRYCGLRIGEIRLALVRALRPMFFSRSIEDVIHTKGNFTKYYLSQIGVNGLVNGKQFIEE